MDDSPPRQYSHGERLALFVPCYVDLLFPQVGKAVVTLFERLGIPFEYPTDQTCCGQPAFNAGHWDEARGVAQHFADVFKPYDWIVVPSGSCGAMCHVFYDYLAPDSDAAEVGKRVCDLATFVVKHLGIADVGARFPYRVTYHDGCHGRRELKAGDAATTLLRAVKDLELVELPAVEECCGFGGLFSVKFDELSTDMGAQKCANARATGADVLVSGDSSCLMHIGGMLARENGPKGALPQLRTMHLAEVLANT
jgi:L-lactate dehydrogenase complex protein LldE